MDDNLHKTPMTRKITEYLIAFINETTPTRINKSAPVTKLNIRKIQDSQRKK